jgi:hypothetical protein
VKSIVCIKRVADTEARIRIAADGRSVDPAGVKFVMNPYDEFALEAALRHKETAGAGEVLALTVGGSESAETLRTALAMGADRALRLEPDAASEGLAVAQAIADALDVVVDRLHPEEEQIVLPVLHLVREGAGHREPLQPHLAAQQDGGIGAHRQPGPQRLRALRAAHRDGGHRSFATIALVLEAGLHRELVVGVHDELHARRIDGSPVGRYADPRLGVRDTLDADDALHAFDSSLRVVPVAGRGGIIEAAV